jgi:hypothetical protein
MSWIVVVWWGLRRSLLIKDRENIAIKNDNKLEKMHSDCGIISPENRVPSTTVHKLVQHLRQLKKQ